MPMVNKRRRGALQFVPVLGLALIVTACGKKPPSDKIIATAGNRSISVSAFKRAYLPVILYTGERDNEQTREKLLNDYLGQKILAQAAETLHLDTLARIDAWVEPIKRNALIRKVYESEVKNDIQDPGEAQLKQAFLRANEQRLVQHLFVSSESTADSLYSLLESGAADFKTLAQTLFRDSTLRENGGRLGWVGFGQLDQTLEDTIYHLPVGKLSHPVHSIYGWHLVRVNQVQRQRLVTRTDYELLKPRLQKIIREREEFTRSRQFINTFMKQADLKFNPETTPRVLGILANQLRALRDGLASRHQPALSERELGIVQNDLTPFLDQPLLTFDHTTWRVKDLIQRLQFMNTRLMFKNLQSAIAYLIRDELLVRQAMDQGYANDPEVKAEVQDRRDQILAQLYLQARWDSLRFTKHTLRAYYNDTWSGQYLAPDSLYLEEILVPTAIQAQRIKTQLEAGQPFDRFARKYSRKGFNRGSLGWQVQGSTPFPVFYNQAVNLPVRTVTDPIRTAAGWSLIRATSRHRHPLPFQQIRERVEEDYRANQWRLFRYKMVRANQTQYPVTVNLDNLKNL